MSPGHPTALSTPCSLPDPDTWPLLPLLAQRGQAVGTSGKAVCGKLCRGLGCLALPWRGGVASISPQAPGDGQDFSVHYLGLEYEVGLRLRGFGVKSCCSPAVHGRDEARLQGRALIMPIELPQMWGATPWPPPPTVLPAEASRVLGSQQLSEQPSAIGFPCSLLLAGQCDTFKSQ